MFSFFAILSASAMRLGLSIMAILAFIAILADLRLAVLGIGKEK